MCHFFITVDLALTRPICDIILATHEVIIVENFTIDNIGEEARYQVALSMIRAN